MSPKWLTSLVRARQLQEDAAQAELAEARRYGHRAQVRAREESDRLDSLCAAEVPGAAAAFVAASVALQAAAATRAAAVETAEEAQRFVDAKHAEFAAAARARLAAERIHEEHQHRIRTEAVRAEQRDSDEVAGRRHAEGDAQ
jgi:flagellar export protein FliJ